MKLPYWLYILLLNFQYYHLVKAYTPQPRYEHGTALIGNKLYVLGGNVADTSKFSPSNDFFYLDVSVPFSTSNITYVDLSDIGGTPKFSRAAVSVGGANKDIIFLFGGGFENGSYGVPLVYTFDTTQNKWSAPIIQGVQPSRRRRLSSVTTTTGKMY